MEGSDLAAKTKVQRSTQDQFSRVIPSVITAVAAGRKQDPRAK